MKITNIETFIVDAGWRPWSFVKVETDEGITGVGEARALNRTETLSGYLTETVPRYVLGHDPFDIERLVQRMSREDFGRAGEVVMTVSPSLKSLVGTLWARPWASPSTVC